MASGMRHQDAFFPVAVLTMIDLPNAPSVSLKLSIIIPTYNEAENIAPLIEMIDRDVRETSREIIVVDDSSPDGTADIVEGLMENRNDLRVVVRDHDRGLVQSINAGIRQAHGETVVWLDADMTMPPHYINEFLNQIYAGADVVVGSRYVQGGGIKGADPENNKTSLLHVWKTTRNSEDGILAIVISKVGNFVVRHLLDPRYYDYTSGFYAVRMSVVDRIQIEGHYLDYCIRLLADAGRQGLKISEVPVVMLPRAHGESKTASSLFTLMGIAFDCFKVILYISWNRKRKS